MRDDTDALALLRRHTFFKMVNKPKKVINIPKYIAANQVHDKPDDKSVWDVLLNKKSGIKNVKHSDDNESIWCFESQLKRANKKPKKQMMASGKMIEKVIT